MQNAQLRSESVKLFDEGWALDFKVFFFAKSFIFFPLGDILICHILTPKMALEVTDRVWHGGGV